MNGIGMWTIAKQNAKEKKLKGYETISILSKQG